jgi:glycosyltransferase involved in cell wall biosynthesis
MATYDRPEVLRKTLASIRSQQADFDYEIIIVDDAGPQSAKEVCRQYAATYFRIDREPKYRNPSVARNLAYKMAVGDVLICMSDDVIMGAGSLQRLVNELQQGEFLLATVWNVDSDGDTRGLEGWPHIQQLTGPKNMRPLFFLGSIRRKDMYAVGGCDEEFTEPGREDIWLGDCLIHGLGLRPTFEDMLGYHQEHKRPVNLVASYQSSMELYKQKVSTAKQGLTPWRGGEPWPYLPCPPATTPIRSR